MVLTPRNPFIRRHGGVGAKVRSVKGLWTASSIGKAPLGQHVPGDHHPLPPLFGDGQAILGKQLLLFKKERKVRGGGARG